MTRVVWLDRPSDANLEAIASVVNEFWREVNAAMLSINREMGFRPLAEWQEWELIV